MFNNQLSYRTRYANRRRASIYGGTLRVQVKTKSRVVA